MNCYVVQIRRAKVNIYSIELAPSSKSEGRRRRKQEDVCHGANSKILSVITIEAMSEANALNLNRGYPSGILDEIGPQMNEMGP